MRPFFFFFFQAPRARSHRDNSCVTRAANAIFPVKLSRKKTDMSRTKRLEGIGINVGSCSSSCSLDPKLYQPPDPVSPVLRQAIPYHESGASSAFQHQLHVLCSPKLGSDILSVLPPRNDDVQAVLWMESRGYPSFPPSTFPTTPSSFPRL